MAEYTETIPCFLMSGDKIIEAFYMRWESNDGETWDAVDRTITVPITEKGTVDRLVVEIPSGCVMTRMFPMNLAPGDTFNVKLSAGGSGNPWERCERPRMAAEEIKQEAVTDGHH